MNVFGKKQKTNFQRQDQISHWLLRILAMVVTILLIAMVIQLFKVAAPAITAFKLKFITSSQWHPNKDEFGALPFIFGTLYTSILALIMAAPVSLAVAIFLNEVCSKKISNILGIFIEMIAAIPSIIFGLWGLFFLAPWIQDKLAPFLQEHFGFLPIFQGVSYGIGILTASVILAIMIIPTITSICREVMRTVPSHQKEAALALGATRYEMIKIAVLRPSFAGIMSAIVLGLGRALGETMAVAMVIGNNPVISASLFSPGATMASVIANEYNEGVSPLHVSSMCYIAVLLFAVTLIVNSIARLIVWRYNRRQNKRS